MATLVLQKVLKNGAARYGIPGVKTSAYFPASMFVGDAPQEISVNEPTEQVQGPDGPLTDDNGEPVVRGLIFATENTQRPRRAGTTSGVKVNAELQAAREEAKRLREESKRVLREAREAAKARRRGQAAGQPSLVDEGVEASA
jgi:hypothetical protein